jgi:murein DD-endopeptidase MepM/ murein hydrolase activator NlpD
VVVGALLGWAAQWLFYLDWHPIAAPLEQDQLVIREDDKGDGRFGAPRSGKRHHRGVDIEATVGSPVRAIRSGTVVESGTHRGLGRYLELEHRGGLQSLYGHLETVMVDVGDRVRQGQVIATVGKTGNARHPLIKPHLHLEVLQDGEPVDPAALGLAVIEPVDQAHGAHAAGGE